jgi:ankyrin repeat protein
MFFKKVFNKALTFFVCISYILRMRYLRVKNKTQRYYIKKIILIIIFIFISSNELFSLASISVATRELKAMDKIAKQQVEIEKAKEQLQKNRELIDAVRGNMLDKVKKLKQEFLEKQEGILDKEIVVADVNSADPRIEDEDGFKQNPENPALYYACLYGYVEIVKELLEWPEIKVDLKNIYGKTPLMAAVLKERDILDETGKLYDSDQVDSIYIEIIELLLTKANVNEKDKTGKTALHIASFECFPDVAALLLKNGANIEEVDQNENTVLHAAIACKYSIDQFSELGLINLNKIVTMFLEKGVDPMQKDRHGIDVLTLCKNLEMIEIKELIENYLEENSA